MAHGQGLTLSLCRKLDMPRLNKMSSLWCLSSTLLSPLFSLPFSAPLLPVYSLSSLLASPLLFPILPLSSPYSPLHLTHLPSLLLSNLLEPLHYPPLCSFPPYSSPLLSSFLSTPFLPSPLVLQPPHPPPLSIGISHYYIAVW